MEDVDGRFCIVIQSLDKRIERGRPEEFPGNATGRVFLQGVEHRLGIGPRIDEPGIGWTADDEQQVKAVLGVDAKWFTSARGSGNLAADADVRFVSKEEGAGGIVQQFPGKRENRGVLGVNGEHTLPVVGILKAIEQTLRGAIVEHGFEECLADFGQPGLDAAGFPIVLLGQRHGAVRFDVPADLGQIPLGDGIGEGKFPGIRAVERDVDFGIARKI